MIGTYPVSPLVEALKAAAICHTGSQAEAVSILMRAAAEILSIRFEPEQAGALIRQCVDEALALHAPAGRA